MTTQTEFHKWYIPNENKFVSESYTPMKIAKEAWNAALSQPNESDTSQKPQVEVWWSNQKELAEAMDREEASFAQPNEPVGQVVNGKVEFESMSSYGHMYIDLPNETLLFTAPPNIEDKIKELEALQVDGEPVAWTITARDGITVGEVPDYAFYSENDAILHRDNHCFKECNVAPLFTYPPKVQGDAEPVAYMHRSKMTDHAISLLHTKISREIETAKGWSKWSPIEVSEYISCSKGDWLHDHEFKALYTSPPSAQALENKVKELEARLLDCSNENIELTDDLKEANKLINLRCGQIQQRDAKIAELTTKNAELKNALNECVDAIQKLDLKVTLHEPILKLLNRD